MAPPPPPPPPEVPSVPSLLSLPLVLLHEVLAHLTDATDLAAAAATCAALRRTVRDATWPAVAAFAAHVWTPVLPDSLAWAAEHLPQLRSLDLSGASACSDNDLLPLSQLTSLRALSLAGLWRFTGSSSASGAGRRRGPGSTPGMDVLAAVLRPNAGLLALNLSRTAVPVGNGLAAALAWLTAGAPNATRHAHGLQRLHLAGCGCEGGGGGAARTALRQVLLQCPALVELDLSGCSWLTHEDLPADDPVLCAALADLPMRRASFAGCHLLAGVGWLLGAWEHLQALDLSGTSVDDTELELIANGCTQLCRLDLGRCLRMKGPGLHALTASTAVLEGHLTSLHLSDLAWVGERHLSHLLRALGQHAAAPIDLDLTCCGGLGDFALLALHPSPEPHGCCLHSLCVGGSGKLSGATLQQLAAAGSGGLSLLKGLQHLDCSHVVALSKQAHARPDAGAGSSPEASALAAMLTAAGSSLRSAVLDGCWVGTGLLPMLANCCPGIERLSLVGCSGLADADLAALSTLRGLSDLSMGGANLAWHEHHALKGLRGLTRLRIVRRSFLTDAQLAPVLAATRGSLRRLELVACASLTDAALLHLLPPAHERQGVEAEVDGEEGKPPQSLQQQQQPLPQARPAPLLEHLQLVACDRITGRTLRQLARLRSLRLSGCPQVSEAALQATAISCRQLTLLELPSHVPASCMPIAPASSASHLRGLQLQGGAEDCGVRRGGRGRRSSGAAG